MPNQEYGRQRRNGDYERRRHEARDRGWEDAGENWDDEDSLEARAFGGYPDYRRDRYERQQSGYPPFREGRSYRRAAGYPEASRSYPGGEYPQEQRGDEFSRREEPYAPARYGEAESGGRYGRPGPYDAQHHGGMRQNYQREEARRYGADWGQGRGYAAGGYGYGEGEQAPGFYGQPGRAQGAPHQSFDQDDDNEFEHDYRAWRREQIKALDDDYRAYRSERQQKFSDDFETYRKNKTKSGSSTGSSSSSSSSGAGKSSS